VKPTPTCEPIINVSAIIAARMACYLLRYSAEMLADPALSSTNMFGRKKMVGKNTHQVQQGRKTMKLFHL
jgi:hypothetical protein